MLRTPSKAPSDKGRNWNRVLACGFGCYAVGFLCWHVAPGITSSWPDSALWRSLSNSENNVLAPSKETLWKYTSSDYNSFLAPVVDSDGSSVLVPSQKGVVTSLSAKTGSLNYNYATGGVWGDASIPQQAVLVSTDSDDSLLMMPSFQQYASSYVYAIEKDTGKIRWKYTNADPNSLVSAVIDGANKKRPGNRTESPTVFLTTANAGWKAPNGHVKALSKSNGTETWSFTPSTRNLDSVDSTEAGAGTVAFQGFVAAPVCGASSVFAASQSRHIYALDADTGAVVWDTKVDPYNLGSQVVADPVLSVDGATLYVATSSTLRSGAMQGSLYALSTRDGSEVWHKPLNGGVRVSLAVDDDTIYVKTQNSATAAACSLSALFRGDGSQRWAVPAVACSPLQLHGPTASLYTLGGSDGTNVLALGTNDGSLSWSWAFPSNGTMLTPRGFALSRDGQYLFLTAQFPHAADTIDTVVAFATASNGTSFGMDVAPVVHKIVTYDA